ncbi:MAG: glycosyltransferase family 4 protein [Verrucomicrobiota bacterium]
MRTLFIGKIWPEPESSAAGQRTLSLIEAVQEMDWPVTFASTAQPNEYSFDPERSGISTNVIAVNDSSFDRWISDLNPELVVFDRFMMEEQFGWRVSAFCPDCLQILDTSDLHCLREARRVQILGQKSELDLFNEIALREIASIFRSDLSLIISEMEIGILADTFQVPLSQCIYLPLMVDAPDANPLAYENRRNFVMIGNYLHAPNWDAVTWCCKSIWPNIRRALPEAELHIYGAYEPTHIREQASKKLGIRTMGRAKSSLETLGQYRVNVAPLRFGAGQKGKVADGLCSGTPTVVTPIAAESMNGAIDWGCLITDDADGFAQTAVDVYSDQSLWSNVQKQGFKIVEERLLKSKWKPRFVERIRSIDPVRRNKNFIGRMLRHHNHRSTEYMSRWIELKNKQSNR